MGSILFIEDDEIVCSLAKAEAGASNAPGKRILPDSRFDGDRCSLTVLYTEESKASVNKLLKSRKFYVSPAGKLYFSSATDIAKYVVASITG